MDLKEETISDTIDDVIGGEDDEEVGPTLCSRDNEYMYIMCVHVLEQPLYLFCIFGLLTTVYIKCFPCDRHSVLWSPVNVVTDGV